MQFADIISVFALVIGIVALLISWYSFRTADRAARNDIVAELRAWGGEVIELLSDGGELCSAQAAQRTKEDFSALRSRLSTRASSLLDRGRFFFPNIEQGAFGNSKSPAYKGRRSPVLDLLLMTFELSRNIDSKPPLGDEDRRRAFIHIKRAFVSAIQKSTGLSTPLSLAKYEAFLPTVEVEVLPEEIRDLARVSHRAFEIKFSSEIKMTAGYQEPVANQAG